MDRIVPISEQLLTVLGVENGICAYISSNLARMWKPALRSRNIELSGHCDHPVHLVIEHRPKQAKRLLRRDLLKQLIDENGIALIYFRPARPLWLGRLNKKLESLWRGKRRNRKVVKLKHCLDSLTFIPLEITPSLSHPATIRVLTYERRKGHFLIDVSEMSNHSGLALLISMGRRPFDALLGSLMRLLPEPMRDVSIADIYLRDRGAVIARLRSPMGNTFIARIAASDDIASIISRNHKMLTMLRSCVPLPSTCRNVLPKVVATSERTSIEEAAPGILAWQLVQSKPQLRGNVLEQAWKFSSELQKVTATTKILDENQVDELIGKDIELLQGFCVGDTFVENCLLTMRDFLYRNLVGKVVSITLAHGDYGPGNLFFDPSAGTLTGVIDWDTYRAVDLPGVDFLNFIFQDFRATNSLSSSLLAVRRWLNDENWLSLEFTRLLSGSFQLVPNFRDLYCQITAMHVLGRDMRYRSGRYLSREEADLIIAAADIGRTPNLARIN
ncbi:MAG: phosphotransferase [Gammaproteobacteria bacterium]